MELSPARPRATYSVQAGHEASVQVFGDPSFGPRHGFKAYSAQDAANVLAPIQTPEQQATVTALWRAIDMSDILSKPGNASYNAKVGADQIKLMVDGDDSTPEGSHTWIVDAASAPDLFASIVQTAAALV